MSGLLGRWCSWLVGVGAHSNEVMPVNEMALPVWRASAGPMVPSRNPQKQGATGAEGAGGADGTRNTGGTASKNTGGAASMNTGGADGEWAPGMPVGGRRAKAWHAGAQCPEASKSKSAIEE